MNSPVTVRRFALVPEEALGLKILADGDRMPAHVSRGLGDVHPRGFDVLSHASALYGHFDCRDSVSSLPPQPRSGPALPRKSFEPLRSARRSREGRSLAPSRDVPRLLRSMGHASAVMESSYAKSMLFQCSRRVGMTQEKFSEPPRKRPESGHSLLPSATRQAREMSEGYI